MDDVKIQNDNCTFSLEIDYPIMHICMYDLTQEEFDSIPFDDIQSFIKQLCLAGRYDRFDFERYMFVKVVIIDNSQLLKDITPLKNLKTDLHLVGLNVDLTSLNGFEGNLCLEKMNVDFEGCDDLYLSDSTFKIKYAQNLHLDLISGCEVSLAQFKNLSIYNGCKVKICELEQPVTSSQFCLNFHTLGNEHNQPLTSQVTPMNSNEKKIIKVFNQEYLKSFNQVEIDIIGKIKLENGHIYIETDTLLLETCEYEPKIKSKSKVYTTYKFEKV